MGHSSEQQQPQQRRSTRSCRYCDASHPLQPLTMHCAAGDVGATLSAEMLHFTGDVRTTAVVHCCVCYDSGGMWFLSLPLLSLADGRTALSEAGDDAST